MLRVCEILGCHAWSAGIGEVQRCVAHLTESRPDLVVALTQQQLDYFTANGMGEATARQLYEAKVKLANASRRGRVGRPRRWLNERDCKKASRQRVRRRRAVESGLDPAQVMARKPGRPRRWRDHNEASRMAMRWWRRREFEKTLRKVRTFGARELLRFSEKLLAEWKRRLFLSVIPEEKRWEMQSLFLEQGERVGAAH
jgi:hypothetical protein